MKTTSPCVNYIQYGGGQAVWWRVFSMDAISSVRWKIFSTDVSHHQYGGSPSSVWWRVCSMDLSHHQYGGECVVQDYQNCSGSSWWLHLSGKMIFYRQSYHNPHFIILWLNPDVGILIDHNGITFSIRKIVCKL